MAADMVNHSLNLDSSSDKEADTIGRATAVLDEGGRTGWAAVAGVYVF